MGIGLQINCWIEVSNDSFWQSHVGQFDVSVIRQQEIIRLQIAIDWKEEDGPNTGACTCGRGCYWWPESFRWCRIWLPALWRCSHESGESSDRLLSRSPWSCTGSRHPIPSQRDQTNNRGMHTWNEKCRDTTYCVSVRVMISLSFLILAVWRTQTRDIQNILAHDPIKCFSSWFSWRTAHGSSCTSRVAPLQRRRDPQHVNSQNHSTSFFSSILSTNWFGHACSSST